MDFSQKNLDGIIPPLVTPFDENEEINYFVSRSYVGHKNKYKNPEAEKDKIIFKLVSKSFLQQQVRSMVGSIKYLGDGKWNIVDFKKSFKSKNRLKCAPPAPACGLYLTKVKY